MARSRSFFAAALAGAALWGAATARPVQAQFGISERQEIDAGRQAAQQAFRQFGQPVAFSDPRQQRVSRIGAILARGVERRNIPYTFTVIGNERVVNAFAAPGGPVVATSRLVDVTANDAELAFVIAHEIGHIEERHAVRSAQRQGQVGLAANVLGALLGRSVDPNIINVVGSIGLQAWASSYSRDMEREADDYAVRAMARAGFDPRGAPTMLARLGGGGGGAFQWLSTHPAPSSRQARANEIIQNENLVEVATRAGGPATSLTSLTPAGLAPALTSTATTVGAGGTGTSASGIEVRVVTVGGGRVVLAAVTDVARFAGGSARGSGRQVEVARGRSSALFENGSNVAIVNGQRVVMSAPAQNIGGRFFAPLGTVAQGLGGNASFIAASNSVRVDFGAGRVDTIAL